MPGERPEPRRADGESPAAFVSRVFRTCRWCGTRYPDAWTCLFHECRCDGENRPPWPEADTDRGAWFATARTAPGGTD
ncbi:hypothetical protein [Amycolatopsis albispora]|uniref:hypothetical protein n=1 Tax=Amycolatopsis albispora TaxID=1804986 RepID=UPI0013B3D3AC|nr:hypothetical protein [Amycolatopsis albispora]